MVQGVAYYLNENILVDSRLVYQLATLILKSQLIYGVYEDIERFFGERKPLVDSGQECWDDIVSNQ